jgi:hypothetical protein
MSPHSSFTYTMILLLASLLLVSCVEISDATADSTHTGSIWNRLGIHLQDSTLRETDIPVDVASVTKESPKEPRTLQSYGNYYADSTYYPSFGSDEADWNAPDPFSHTIMNDYGADSSFEGLEEYYLLAVQHDIQHASDSPIDTLGVLPLPELTPQVESMPDFGAGISFAIDEDFSFTPNEGTSFAADAGVTTSHKYFGPLACNAALQFATTSEVCSESFAGFLADANHPTDAQGRALIPCGVCLKWDMPAGSTTDVPEGLHVEGMLYIPSLAYSGVEDQPTLLTTTSIFVEGIWQMDPPSYQTDSEQTKLFKVEMYGTADPQNMTPSSHSRVVDHCEVGGCDFGKKTIAVVGGRLNMRGYNEAESGCVSWSKLQVISTDRRTVTLAPRGITSYDRSQGPPDLSCWRPGDEILMTSPDMNFKFAHVAIVESVNHTEGSIYLTPNTTAPEWFTFASEEAAERDDGESRLATEVVHLTRPIIFAARMDDPTNDYHQGAHFMWYHTPSPSSSEAPPQHLQGVDIQRFGQQGTLGKYVSHFLVLF